MPKLIKNCIESRLSLPKISFEVIEDKTNVQANAQMKTARSIRLLNVDAMAWLEAPKADAIEVMAECVKIW